LTTVVPHARVRGAGGSGTTFEQREEPKKAASRAFVALFHLDMIATSLNGPRPEMARWRTLFLDLQ
jgi:hypothetical protein